MSTFLQLAQKLRQEAEIPGTGPSAVTGQTGQLKRVVDWVADAWRELQVMHPNWRWMRRTFTGTTTTGQSEYAYSALTDTTDSAAISRFSRWIHADDYGCPIFTIYPTSGGVGGQNWLVYRPWDEFRRIYRFGSQSNGQPAWFSITPANKIALGPAPDATGYTFGGDYQMGEQTFDSDDDTPDMPSRFHNLIVYYALEKYGANSVAAEIYSRAVRESARLLTALEFDQLPQLALAEPLA